MTVLNCSVCINMPSDDWTPVLTEARRPVRKKQASSTHRQVVAAKLKADLHLGKLAKQSCPSSFTL